MTDLLLGYYQKLPEIATAAHLGVVLVSVLLARYLVYDLVEPDRTEAPEVKHALLIADDRPERVRGHAVRPKH